MDTTYARGVHPLLKVLDFVPMLGIDHRSQDLNNAIFTDMLWEVHKEGQMRMTEGQFVRKLTRYVTRHDVVRSTLWHAVWHDMVWCGAMYCAVAS